MTPSTHTRYIPKHSTEVQHPEGLGVAYTYEYERAPYKTPTFAVVAYGGKANKAAFHESYHRAESRDKRLADYFAGLQAHQAMMAERKAEHKKPHTLKVGDILHHSWGWEQTQCDYYQVVAVTAHGATIREIGNRTVPDSEVSNGMADRRVAVPNGFCGESLKVKVDGYNRVCVSKGALSHGSCGLWDGQAKYCSWYG